MNITDELDNKLRARRAAQCETFDMSTPILTPRNAIATEVRRAFDSMSPEPQLTPRGGNIQIRPWYRDLISRFRIGILVACLTCAFILYRMLPNLWLSNSDHSSDSGPQRLNSLYEEKLKNVAKGIASLENLSQIVVTADETYEDVYHNQLVQHVTDSKSPHEVDWNGFVQEARQTGPVFMDGKEKLRDAVTNMQRLIRRAPEHLRSMVHWLTQQNSEEASWYLGKVVKLVDSVHHSMEEAANRFSNAETTIGGMMRDAKENADRFELKASDLEGEVKALEGSPTANSGRWSRTSQQAFYGCQLESLRLPLADCKMKCINHESGGCNRVSYYKMASGKNCYLHCETSSPSSYTDADAYTLELGPLELAAEVQQKANAVTLAVNFKSRWQSVRSPLQEVTRLVRRFRAATGDLRKSLEDARFATDDLMAAFKPMQKEKLEMKEGRELRLLERQVEDVIAAIEDLGDSLAVLRFQS